MSDDERFKAEVRNFLNELGCGCLGAVAVIAINLAWIAVVAAIIFYIADYFLAF